MEDEEGPEKTLYVKQVRVEGSADLDVLADGGSSIDMSLLIPNGSASICDVRGVHCRVACEKTCSGTDLGTEGGMGWIGGSTQE